MKNNKLDHYFTAYIRINSKWIKKLNVVPETIKLPEENISGELFDTSRHLFSENDTTIKSKQSKVSETTLD